MAAASFLEGHPAVATVYYPGLASHPDHAIAARQMCGFGGMVCVDLVKSLNKFKVDAGDQKALVGVLGSMKGDIVEKK
jgi:cystathionine beta-lyase/cystathionine gamma-synthase